MRRLLPLLLAAGLSTSAAADNVAFCEVLILQVIADEDMNGEAQVATYGPAVHFITSVYDDEEGHVTQSGGHPIRALMCNRNDVIPTKTDYALIATGIPFILSQDFDSTDTDSLTMFWKDGKLEHVYKGYPLSDESQAILDKRLASFSKRGLNQAAKDAQKKAEEQVEKIVETKTEDTEVDETEVEIAVESDAADEVAESIERITDTHDVTPGVTELASETETDDTLKTESPE